MSAATPTPATRRTPFYRNVKVLSALAQIAFVVLIVLALTLLVRTLLGGLRRSGIPLDWEFLRQTAGFAIPESGIPYQPTDSFGRALLVGIVNTLRVSLLGIVLATLLGVTVGVARLSPNWVLRTIATSYVELFRNIPLLVQLIFWFSAVILKLPRVRDSVGIPGWFLANNRGVAVAWFTPGPGFAAWQPWLWAGLAVLPLAYVVRRAQLARQERPGSPLPLALLASGALVLLGALVAFATSGAPLLLDQPVLQGFNYTGGVSFSAAFFALLLGLTTYTAAFIAEIVRAGILSVNRGQREAALAVGLTSFQTLRLIVFPQALRVIIPPLTNQYLNLIKNSSLGIAIGYFDLFNVANTIQNVSGRVPQVVLLMMLTYLTFSLLTALFTNLYNRRVRLVER